MRCPSLRFRVSLGGLSKTRDIPVPPQVWSTFPPHSADPGLQCKAHFPLLDSSVLPPTHQPRAQQSVEEVLGFQMLFALMPGASAAAPESWPLIPTSLSLPKPLPRYRSNCPVQCTPQAPEAGREGHWSRALAPLSLRFSACVCASPHLYLQLPVSVSPPLLGGSSSSPGLPAGPASSPLIPSLSSSHKLQSTPGLETSIWPPGGGSQYPQTPV